MFHHSSNYNLNHSLNLGKPSKKKNGNLWLIPRGGGVTPNHINGFIKNAHVVLNLKINIKKTVKVSQIGEEWGGGVQEVWNFS